MQCASGEDVDDEQRVVATGLNSKIKKIKFWQSICDDSEIRLGLVLRVAASFLSALGSR